MLAERTSGDGRVFHLPIPSAAWRPPASRPKAHGFASPSFDGFALSRMKGVVGSERDTEACPRKPPQNLAASFANQLYGAKHPAATGSLNLCQWLPSGQ